MESITKGSEIITYEYDGIISTSEIITGTLNESLTYIYNNDTIDKDFRMDGFTYAGETELYTYDDDGLLTAIGNFTISRKPENGLPEGVSDTVLNLVRGFNGFGEIDSETVDVSSANGLYSWNVIERDNSGRIKEKTETINGETIQNENGVRKWGRNGVRSFLDTCS